MKRITALSALALLFVVGGTARGQSRGDWFTYAAVLTTPVGTVPTSPLIGSSATGNTAVSGFYGMVPRDGSVPTQRLMAMGYTLPLGGGSSTFTAGLGECSGCPTAYKFGVDWLGTQQGNELKVGFRPALGYSHEGGTNAWAAAISAPITWVPPNATGFRVTPYFEPGFAIGGMWADESESGSRFMMSGGMVLSSPNAPLSVTGGARRVLIDNGRTIYSLGVTWR